ncbi:MAG: hypothetical protein IPL40_04755 [Proteobacteria bacterium]|nr:hypothetical protein [Pseudomonadota bacterium]
MTQRSVGGGAGRPPTDFDRFEGEIELDQSRPARVAGGNPPVRPLASPVAPDPVGSRRPTGSGLQRSVVDQRAALGHGNASTARPGRSTARLERSTAGGRGAWALPLIALAVVALLGLAGYRLYSSYRANQLRFAFHARAQDLRQALLQLGHPPGRGEISAAVGRFARDTGVTLEQIEPSIEPLNDVTVNKLPQPTRIALGIAAKLPRYRLPYAVVGFRARLSARYGMTVQRFDARHYTHFDSEVAGDGGRPGGGDATPAAIGRQVEEQLQRRMKRALGPDAL